MLWLTGGSLALALMMIVGLLLLVTTQGLVTFWPSEILQVQLDDGRALAGEVTRTESFAPEGATVRRRLLRTGNYELTGEHFAWIADSDVRGQEHPPWFLVVERMSWGRFYGAPVAFRLGDERVAEGPEAAWAAFRAHHGPVRERWERRRDLERGPVGDINHALERGRLKVREVELAHGVDSQEVRDARAALQAESVRLDARYAEVREEIVALDGENDRYGLVLRTADGTETELLLADVVRAYPANQLGFVGKVGVYLSRWWEYLSDEPREANSEGGIWPALFGTVMMTMIMVVLVVPFGVLAALYLREYAKQGLVTSAVRIAVNNLAGVPSIVFGVFGLGFFCYIVGGNLDALLFGARLPTPTFGTGGILWAALTLALLTLPVVIVATEEALAAVPGSMREGSYACGASKWQTIRRIVLPRAMPGIMTGLILAIARGAGEVAPLMLVGAVKLAPDLPLDGHFPFLHLERSFMHLGFHIYDLGFQSQNSEAAKPMVFTTTLLLIALVVLLNVAAVSIRTRLRARFVMGKF
ncbi:MAG: phosphate ABC transporter permease PstA [Planctomycetota bacterium]|jgi:phosphate transport system permease protein